jgi:hypothetical protein
MFPAIAEATLTSSREGLLEGTMPSNPLAPGALALTSGFQDWDSGLPVPNALGRRPALDEGTEAGPPPAAIERAQTVFETTGIALVFLIVVSAVWILVRNRL